MHHHELRIDAWVNRERSIEAVYSCARCALVGPREAFETQPIDVRHPATMGRSEIGRLQPQSPSEADLAVMLHLPHRKQSGRYVDVPAHPPNVHRVQRKHQEEITMGHLHAIEFAAAVRRDQLSLAAALEYHLTVNHYPPVPSSMIPACIKAIAAAREDDAEREITLPVGNTFKGWPSAPAFEIINGLHLAPFIGEEDIDDCDGSHYAHGCRCSLCIGGRVPECDASPDSGAPSPRDTDGNKLCDECGADHSRLAFTRPECSQRA